MEPYDIKNIPVSGCGGKVFLATLLALLVGFGGGWYWFGGSKEEPLSEEEAFFEEEVGNRNEDAGASFLPPASLPGASIKNAVSAGDQPAGNVVGFATATLEEGSWVVVHEDMGGQPGKILGARRFAAGTHVGGIVELLRPTIKGGGYYVMLHQDNGDKQFDHVTDLPIRDAGGSPVMKKFSAK